MKNNRLLRTKLKALVFLVGTLLTACACGETLETWQVLPVQERQRCPNEPQIWRVKAGLRGIEAESRTLEQEFDSYPDNIKETPQFSVGKFKTFPRIIRKVDGGTIVAYSRGEWGGAIWFFSDQKDKAQPARRLMHPYYQVSKFIERDGELYALEGLAHLATRRGTFLKFERYPSGYWDVKPIAILPGEPGPYLWAGKREMLVVSDNSLIRLNLDGDRNTLHIGKDESQLSRATSIAMDAAGVLYVGAEEGVVRLTPQAGRYKEEWLVKPGSARNCARPEMDFQSNNFECLAPVKRSSARKK